MRCSVYIVCPSALSCSNLKLLEVKNIFKQEKIVLQLTLNRGFNRLSNNLPQTSSSVNLSLNLMNYQWVWEVFRDAIQIFPWNYSFHSLIGLDGSQDSSLLIPVTLGSTDTWKTRTIPGDCVTRLAYRTTNVTRTTCKTNQSREFVIQTSTGQSLRLSTEVSNSMEELKILSDTKKRWQKSS